MNNPPLTTAFRFAARIPATLTLSALALTIACIPLLGDSLQFDRTAIASGELWRLATAHLTHWNTQHLAWDLLMFVTVGALCELRNPRQMRLCVALSATAVSALVLVRFPEISFYRGLSGIDTALFTLLAVTLLRDALQQRNHLLTFTTAALLLGFVGKTAYEAVTGQALFVDQHSAGFQLLIWDHITAGIIGALLAYKAATGGRGLGAPNNDPPPSHPHQPRGASPRFET